MVAGKTGSGKSSLLHTLITSACIDYGPDQLRLVLLDFKKGVEFQVYAEANLPHADIIAMESEREFGVSALEYLDRLMQQRGEQFRSVGCQDVAGWRKARPDIPMPRVLLVIDEFQELFVEDDKLGQTASMYL
ncbi:MAG: FtsK/SpoIIIE domain-containing protein, partial [Pirellulaceae bacterium]